MMLKLAFDSLRLHSVRACDTVACSWSTFVRSTDIVRRLSVNIFFQFRTGGHAFVSNFLFDIPACSVYGRCIYTESSNFWTSIFRFLMPMKAIHLQSMHVHRMMRSTAEYMILRFLTHCVFNVLGIRMKQNIMLYTRSVKQQHPYWAARAGDNRHHWCTTNNQKIPWADSLCLWWHTTQRKTIRALIACHTFGE